MAHSLSEANVARLVHDRSVDARTETATQISVAFAGGEMLPRERAIAVDIFRLMALDAAIGVRKALAQNLRDCPDLPRDIARQLAADVESVSLPMLERSVALTDQDLIEIVASLNRAKQSAIARRPSVSEMLSEALVAHGDTDVVAMLFENQGARIAVPTMLKAVDRFGEAESVTTALVRRGDLPATVAERLIARVSDELRLYLQRRHKLDERLAGELTQKAREQATITLLSNGLSDTDLMSVIEQMRLLKRLTPSFLLRALCEGDQRFFEAGIAKLAGVPWLNASKLINDGGMRGLGVLCRNAGVPKQMFLAFYAAVQVARETKLDGGAADLERRARRAIERLMSQIELVGPLDDENIRYLMDKIEKLPPTRAAAEAAAPGAGQG